MRSAFFGGMTAMAALAVAGGALAADMKLTRVQLSTGGLGLFEYEADIDGDATVELKVRRDQVADVLKSLVVFDDHGGVGGLDLASAEPLAETFRSLPFNPADIKSESTLLAALRGAEIEVAGPHALVGRIVDVEERRETRGADVVTVRHRVTAISDKGLEQFVLEDADAVRFKDADVRAAIDSALSAIAANARPDERVLKLSAKGQGARKLRVAYLAAAPVWKTSYRLVLGADPQATRGALQGWATLENLTGEDWREVDLTLVSGRPVAFHQDLYRAYMIQRPEAPVDLGPTLAPTADRGAVAASARAPSPALRALPMVTKMARMAAPSADASLAPGAEAVAAREGVAQAAFHVPSPVSLRAGRTLSLPIVEAEPPVERVALYDPSVDLRHPLIAAELHNDGAAALPPGIVTVYAQTPTGAAFVGDAQLSATPAGETRLLSFALDEKTTIETDSDEASTLARARLAKGVLTREDLTRRREVFQVRADEPRKLVAIAPQMQGGHLTAPVHADLSEGKYRAAFDVKPGDAQTFVIEQERTDSQAIELESLDAAALRDYAANGEIDAATRGALARLAELRAAQADAERALTGSQSKIDEVTGDQTRLKELLGAVGAGSDLAKRYLGELDVDETTLATLRAGRATREQARDDARGAVEAYVAAL